MLYTLHVKRLSLTTCQLSINNMIHLNYMPFKSTAYILSAMLLSSLHSYFFQVGYDSEGGLNSVATIVVANDLGPYLNGKCGTCGQY